MKTSQHQYCQMLRLSHTQKGAQVQRGVCAMSIRRVAHAILHFPDSGTQRWLRLRGPRLWDPEVAQALVDHTADLQGMYFHTCVAPGFTSTTATNNFTNDLHTGKWVWACALLDYVTSPVLPFSCWCTHAHTNTHTHTHAHTHSHTETRTRACRYTHMHAYMHADTHASTRTRAHAHMCGPKTHTHMRTHAHARAHTHQPAP